MGVFTDDGGPAINQPEEETVEVETGQEEPTRFDTDVEGVTSDGQISQGTNQIPVFKVDHGSFYQNMKQGRRRLRFKTGTNAQQYMSKTQYKSPFYIEYTDDKGKTYTRKIK